VTATVTRRPGAGATAVLVAVSVWGAAAVITRVVDQVNGLVLAFVRYRAILPLPTPLLATRLAGAAANAFAEELQFRSIVLGMLIYAGLPGGVGTALVVQALLYGLAHRRLWNERDWYFLAGSVILGYAAGLATVSTGSVVPAMVGHFAVTASLFAFAGGRLRQRPI